MHAEQPVWPSSSELPIAGPGPATWPGNSPSTKNGLPLVKIFDENPKLVMHNTDKHWEAWGRQDPYFAVLTDDKFRNKAGREEFFASGFATIEGLVATAKRHFENLNLGSALEFGSGVGRLTIPLCRHFDNVTGVDVSEAMIKEAKANCANFGINNAQFIRSDDRLSAVRETFDFIVSCLVLQHIPNKRGMRIISALLNKLKANGVIVLHFPIRIRLPLPERLVYGIKQTVPASRYLFNLLQNRRFTQPLMQMNEYSFADVIKLASTNDIQEFALTPYFETRFDSVIIFGRRLQKR